MKFTVPIQTARPLLMRPALFAAKDDSRPALNTVHIEAYADGRIVAVAADGFIFGLQEATGEVEEAGSVNVPLDTINAAAGHTSATRSGSSKPRRDCVIGCTRACWVTGESSVSSRR